MVGSNEFRDFRKIVLAEDGESWLRLDPPEEKNAPFDLSAIFYDDAGGVSLEIERNDWLCPTNVWDFEVDGPRMTIRTAPGHIALQLRAAPPDKLIIERLDMWRGSLSLLVDTEGAVSLRRGTFSMEMALSSAMGADAVFVL